MPLRKGPMLIFAHYTPVSVTTTFVTSPVSPPACNTLFFPWKKCFFSVFSLSFPYCYHICHNVLHYFTYFDFYLVDEPWIRSRCHPSRICLCYHCAILAEGWLINLYMYFILLLHFRIDNKHMSSNPTFSIGPTQSLHPSQGHALMPHPPYYVLTHPPTHHITSSD